MDRTKSDDPFWLATGARWFPLGAYNRREFGGIVRKISVDAHFSCPNIDGTVGRGGCVFCDAASFSPSRRFGLEDVDAQIDDGIRQLQRRYRCDKFIAYFQPSTNTHAPIETLERVYEIAARRPEIVGLAIGTRPDAVSDPVLDLLARFAERKWLSLELGLQSSKDATLRWLNRGHDYAQFADATRRARRRGLRVCAHAILCLPGETREDMLLTARRVASLGLHALKLHHLYVVKNTRLAALYASGEVAVPTVEEYAERAADFLEVQDPNAVIERLSGEASEEYLIAPSWTAIKHCARNAIDAALRRRGSRQGKFFDPNWRDS